MNNSILLNSPQTDFEAHRFADRELPMIYHELASTHGRANIHETLEILYVRTGAGQVRCDGQALAVRAGDVVVINAYTAHDILPLDGLSCSCLIIDDAFCRQNGIDPGALLFRRLIRDREVQIAFCRVGEAFDDRGDFRQAAVRSAVLDLLVLLCRRHSSTRGEASAVNKAMLRYIHLAIGYLREHLGARITADQVAAHVGLSKYYFLREFKKNTGYTLISYLNILRCERAMTLLQSGQHSVKEVALLCGFENHSYFANVFKRYTATLPSEVLHRRTHNSV